MQTYGDVETNDEVFDPWMPALMDPNEEVCEIKVCSMIVDDGSPIKLASLSINEILGLSLLMNHEPYVMQWLKDTENAKVVIKACEGSISHRM